MSQLKRIAFVGLFGAALLVSGFVASLEVNQRPTVKEQKSVAARYQLRQRTSGFFERSKVRSGVRG